MWRHGEWFGIVSGFAAIAIGLYALRRPSSVAHWLGRQGILDSGTAAPFLRIKVLGALFILAGAFFVAVTIAKG
jgi:hypothetical protein